MNISKKLKNKKLYAILSTIFNCQPSEFTFEEEDIYIFNHKIPGVDIYCNVYGTLSIRIKNGTYDSDKLYILILSKLNDCPDVIVIETELTVCHTYIRFDLIDNLKNDVII